MSNKNCPTEIPSVLKTVASEDLNIDKEILEATDKSLKEILDEKEKGQSTTKECERN